VTKRRQNTKSAIICFCKLGHDFSLSDALLKKLKQIPFVKFIL
jgi:hypothetical protein